MAVAYACRLFGLECTVYMLKKSYDEKPYRRQFMEMLGARVVASPSDQTEAGRQALHESPNHSGSLGVAIAEAIEEVQGSTGRSYAFGSVLNSVLLHQSVIGLEAMEQMKVTGDDPDTVIASCGGGSNFGGVAFPFLREAGAGRHKRRVIAVEPRACPILTRGRYAYDYSDAAGIGPILKMYTIGHRFVPGAIHAAGLRYHGDSPIVSALYERKVIEARAVGQREVFEAGTLFAETEGIVPAPESAHAIRVAIDEATRGEVARGEVILFSVSGNGLLDLAAYEEFQSGRMTDVEPSLTEIEESMNAIPKVPIRAMG